MPVFSIALDGYDNDCMTVELNIRGSSARAFGSAGVLRANRKPFKLKDTCRRYHNETGRLQRSQPCCSRRERFTRPMSAMKERQSRDLQPRLTARMGLQRIAWLQSTRQRMPRVALKLSNLVLPTRVRRHHQPVGELASLLICIVPYIQPHSGSNALEDQCWLDSKTVKLLTSVKYAASMEHFDF